MPITDIEAYCSKPARPDNGFPEDGDYYGIAGKGSFRQVHDGTSCILEIPVKVNEGEYAGHEVNVALFYYLRGEWQEETLERMKKIMAQTDERLMKETFTRALENFASVIGGRKVKIRQFTGKTGKRFLNLDEVYDSSFVGGSELLTENDIPF